MSDQTALVVAVVLLALNAFFVGAEFALVSARRSQIEPKAAEGSRAARTTLRAMEDVSLVMAGAQLGITVCSLGLGALGEPAVAHLIEPGFEALGLPEAFVHPVAFAIALLLVVYLHVVLGEMVPKNLAIAGPTRAALVLGPPMMLVVTLLKPVVWSFNLVANLVLRALRVEPRDEVASAFTRDEVGAMVAESREEGLLEQGEYQRLADALGFTERTVEAVTLPLDTLSVAHRGVTVAEVERLCGETGYSRFPVEVDGDLVGYLHVKDVLETDPSRHSRVVEDKWVRPLGTVRSGDVLHVALSSLQRRGAHMGRVVDDEGRTLGVVMLEDLLEELVGEVRDIAHTAEIVQRAR
ncbi:membrane protein [Marmoricola endophyticus]|uniref:Membrane protein n=1 Tax=Marmoricola endophyticus TaxID=2040280 RepID=A0A917BEZ1_9ACTN|nr:hemolysin family protein [Marmoricola endophyticus]GGF38909.1 membrane protein [Marmoricola endophyticus]